MRELERQGGRDGASEGWWKERRKGAREQTYAVLPPKWEMELDGFKACSKPVPKLRFQTSASKNNPTRIFWRATTEISESLTQKPQLPKMGVR